MESSKHLASATLPGNASESIDDWWLRQIERVFQKFEDWYGAKWAAAYGAFPRDRVKRSWASNLEGFSSKPECIAQAMSAQSNNAFPPTLPEFKALCNEAAKRIGDSCHPALPHKLTAEDHKRAADAARAAKSAVSRADADRVAHWATHPRSHQHLRFIFDAARREPAFSAHVAAMVEQGVCSADGHARRFYRDGAWVAV